MRLCPWGWLVRTTCSTNWSSPRSNSRPGTKHQDPPNTKVQDRLPNTKILYQTPTKHHYIVCRIYRKAIDKNWYLVQAKVAAQFLSVFYLFSLPKKQWKRCLKEKWKRIVPVVGVQLGGQCGRLRLSPASGPAPATSLLRPDRTHKYIWFRNTNT